MKTQSNTSRRVALGGVVLGGISLILLMTGRDAIVAQDTQAKLLRHVVLFKFKQSATPDQVAKLVEAFRELPKKISTIVDFEYGVNNSPEGLNEGLTHCFLVTFKNEKDRDAYLPHAAHKAFVDMLLPHLEKAVVLDYMASK